MNYFDGVLKDFSMSVDELERRLRRMGYPLSVFRSESRITMELDDQVIAKIQYYQPRERKLAGLTMPYWQVRFSLDGVLSEAKLKLFNRRFALYVQKGGG